MNNTQSKMENPSGGLKLAVGNSAILGGLLQGRRKMPDHQFEFAMSVPPRMIFEGTLLPTDLQ
jgi:hypothetical protein